MHRDERLLADLSLWSADLGRLEDEILRAEEHADLFHFDVADGHFVPSLLFFPEIVARLRPLTRKPFHVHLIVERPDQHCLPFLEAGADLLTVHLECGAHSRRASETIRAHGRQCGLALRLETPLASLLDWPAPDAVLLLGTPAGVKGCGLADEALPRLAEARRLLPGAFLIADGAIRDHTVPLLRAAGADAIVPGSLYFNATDRTAVTRWWRGL